MTLAAGMAARVIPGASLHEMLWDIPYCMLGFLVMQERRAAGVKGIGRPEKDEKIWKAWKKMQSEKPDEQANQGADKNTLGQDGHHELGL